MNDAVSFIKKAGRNLLLTIERADVTEDQGEANNILCRGWAFCEEDFQKI